MLAGNPVSDLPHYRLFLIFHLRSLECLDGQPISEQEREKAHQRFYTGIQLINCPHNMAVEQNTVFDKV